MRRPGRERCRGSSGWVEVVPGVDGGVNVEQADARTTGPLEREKGVPRDDRRHLLLYFVWNSRKPNHFSKYVQIFFVQNASSSRPRRGSKRPTLSAAAVVQMFLNTPNPSPRCFERRVSGIWGKTRRLEVGYWQDVSRRCEEFNRSIWQFSEAYFRMRFIPRSTRTCIWLFGFHWLLSGEF